MQFFSFRYKKLFFNHLYYTMNQYVDIPNSPQRHTSSDLLRYKSDSSPIIHGRIGSEVDRRKYGHVREEIGG